MPEATNRKVLVDIRDCLLELVYDSGILRGIKVHRPMGSQNTYKAVCEEIEAHLSINARLIAKPPEFAGRVHIRSWEVVYGDMP